MAMYNDYNREVSFEIVESIGVLAAHSTGWKKELNLVKWNGGQPKYDIRDWAPGHDRMSRGVTLHENEMRLIFDLLRKRRAGIRSRQHGMGGAPEDMGDMAAPADMAVPAAPADADANDAAVSPMVSEAAAVSAPAPAPAPDPPPFSAPIPDPPPGSPDPPVDLDDDFDSMEIGEYGEVL